MNSKSSETSEPDLGILTSRETMYFPIGVAVENLPTFVEVDRAELYLGRPVRGTVS